MNDFLSGRPVYRPLNGFASAIRESENAALLPQLRTQNHMPAQSAAAAPDERVAARAVTTEPSHVENGACRTGGSPAVELVQKDGRIEQIVVTCPCGERITLHCSY